MEERMVSVVKPKDNCSEEITEETIVRFVNPQLPEKADQNATNLAAVCCPSFSLD